MEFDPEKLRKATPELKRAMLKMYEKEKAKGPLDEAAKEKVRKRLMKMSADPFALLPAHYRHTFQHLEKMEKL